MHYNNFNNVQHIKMNNNTDNNYELQVSKEDIKIEFMENKYSTNSIYFNNNKKFNEYNNGNILENEKNMLTNYDNIPPLRKNFEDNLFKTPLKRPESLINKFPIITEKHILNNENNKINEINDVRVINMLEHCIINKIKKINFYNNLMLKIKDEEEKIILNEIRLDKQKHEKLLLEMYQNIKPLHKENFIKNDKIEEIIVSENMKKEYKKCISNELNTIEIFKRLYFIVENSKMKNLLYEIIIDNLCHGLKLNYCILNYS